MNEFDKQITQNLKVMLETPLLFDEQEKWQDFAQKIKDENSQNRLVENKNRSSWKMKLLLTAASLLIITSCLLLKPQVVNGFKDVLYKWVNQQYDNDFVYSEKRNPEYKPGLHESITFEEAKSMVVYNLKYPQYLPETLTSIEPSISVSSKEDPISTVTLKFADEKSYLIIKQKNVLVQKNSSSFVPNNAQVKEVLVHNKFKVFVVENGEHIECNWNEDNLEYHISSQEIAYEDLIAVIESLN